MLPVKTRLLSVTNPAAGAEILVTVPTGVAWRLRSMHFTLTASAVAGNRFVHIIVDNGAGTLAWKYNNGRVQTASQAVPYSVTPNAILATTGLIYEILHLPDMWIPPGARFGTVTGGILAGDQYSGILAVIEEMTV